MTHSNKQFFLAILYILLLWSQISIVAKPVQKTVIRPSFHFLLKCLSFWVLAICTGCATQSLKYSRSLQMALQQAHSMQDSNWKCHSKLTQMGNTSEMATTTKLMATVRVSKNGLLMIYPRVQWYKLYMDIQSKRYCPKTSIVICNLWWIWSSNPTLLSPILNFYQLPLPVLFPYQQ